MKKENRLIKIIIVLIILMPVNVFATGTVNLFSGDYCGSMGKVQFKRLLKPYTGGCENAAPDAASFASNEAGQSEYTGGGCSFDGGYFPAIPAVCSILTVTICCDGTWITQNKEGAVNDSAFGYIQIQNVPIGSEKSSAEQFFNTFSSENAYPVITGKTRTDGIGGFVYSVTAGDDINANVEVTTWKRAQYVDTGGNIIQLEALGSGGGSGGTVSINQNDIKTGVTRGINEAGVGSAFWTEKTTLLNDTAEYTNYLLETMLAQGLPGGGTGGSLNWNGYPGLKPSDLSGTYTAPSAAGSYVVPDSTAMSEKFAPFQTAFNNFKSTIQRSGLFSMHSSFFNAAPSGGSPGVVTIDGGSTFGSHTFDFSNFAPALAILKGIVLVVFSFVAVKTVILKGGA